MIAKKKGCLKMTAAWNINAFKNDFKKGEVKTAASKHYYSLKVDCKKDVCLKKLKIRKITT